MNSTEHDLMETEEQRIADIIREATRNICIDDLTIRKIATALVVSGVSIADKEKDETWKGEPIEALCAAKHNMEAVWHYLSGFAIRQDSLQKCNEILLMANLLKVSIGEVGTAIREYDIDA